jgi:hypothetical protein
VTGIDQTARATAADAQFTADNAIPKNAAITPSGATYKLVQYDSLGRVVSGVDANADNLPDGTNYHLLTTAEKAGLVPRTTRTITGTTDTLVGNDSWQAVKSTDNALTTETIPPNSGTGGVAFDVGVNIGLSASGGRGAMLVVPGAGVTLMYAGNSVPDGVIIPSGQGATLSKTATNTWELVAATTPIAKTYTPTSGTPTVALNCAGKDEHFVDCHADGGAITFTLTGDTNNQCFFVRLLQGAVASTVTAWFSGITWRNTSGGAAPALPAANKVGFYWFLRTGTGAYSGLLISVES